MKPMTEAFSTAQGVPSSCSRRRNAQLWLMRRANCMLAYCRDCRVHGEDSSVWNSVCTVPIAVAHTLTSSSGGDATGLPSVTNARHVAVYRSTQPVARSSVATTARLAMAAAEEMSGGSVMNTPAQREWGKVEEEEGVGVWHHHRLGAAVAAKEVNTI